MKRKDSLNKMPEPWERQLGESDRAFRYFTVFRDLGPVDRKIKTVAETLGVTVASVQALSYKYEWARRASLYDDYIDAETRKTYTRQAQKVREASVSAALKMSSLALQKLKKMDAESLSPKEAKEYLRTAVALAECYVGEDPKYKEIIAGAGTDGSVENDVIIYLPDNGRDSALVNGESVTKEKEDEGE